jgi:hypothetical protein
MTRFEKLAEFVPAYATVPTGAPTIKTLALLSPLERSAPGIAPDRRYPSAPSRSA